MSAVDQVVDEVSVDIVATERRVRIAAAEAAAVLTRLVGEPAGWARARLRLGPGRTYENLARVVDRALAQATRDDDALVVGAASAVAGEDAVRVRRKTHGVADRISSPTSDITVVLRNRDAPADAPAPLVGPPAPSGPVRPVEDRPESAAELRIREVLYDVVDPDLGVNVVDLGFVRRVRLADDGRDTLTMTMTLTSAACSAPRGAGEPVARFVGGAGRRVRGAVGVAAQLAPGRHHRRRGDQLTAIGCTAF